jgi:hypothetical protein
MPGRAIAITAPPDVIRELLEELAGEEVSLSEPLPAESPADALDAPISGEELRQALEVVTLLFSTGTAGLVFAEKLRSVLRRGDSRSARLDDARTGRRLGTADASTDLESLLEPS